MEPPSNEAFLVAIRLTELEQYPVRGAFDVVHLCEVHRRIFQDLPQYHAGQFRPDAPTHVKARVLESLGVRYYVPYAPRRLVDTGLTRTLSTMTPRCARITTGAVCVVHGSALWRPRLLASLRRRE
jgi:fido (protein-threonine AMPylation protein)